MDIEKRLAVLGLTLPAPPTPAGNYVGSVLVDHLLFVGGNVGRMNAEPLEYTGKVGGEVTPEQAYEMARRFSGMRSAAARGVLLALEPHVADHGPWPFGDGGVAAIFERGAQMPSIIP